MNESETTYTVKEGDTLTHIAERYGVSVDDLVKFNHIENPDMIHPGQELKLKDEAAAA